MFIKIFFSALILILSFSFQLSEVNAQCYPGMNYQVETIIIDGCEFEVEICYSCGLTYPGEVSVVGITKVDPNCTTSVGFPRIVKHVYLQISTSTFIYTNLCQDPPPCPEGELISVKRWSCWKIQMIEFNGVDTYKFIPCSYNSYCEEKFAHCWNETEQRVERIFVESNFYGVPECSLEAWEIRLPGDVGEESECYIQNNSCDNE